jgi:ATP-dependent Clp protease adaptor protein ClpS
VSDIEFEIIDETDTSIDEETQEPPLYRVLLLNDDYTTMEFVVQVLMAVFGKGVAEATRIMLKVHHEGSGLCGVYPYEIAETKVDTVHRLASEYGFPLKCIMERDEQ